MARVSASPEDATNASSQATEAIRSYLEAMNGEINSIHSRRNNDCLYLGVRHGNDAERGFLLHPAGQKPERPEDFETLSAQELSAYSFDPEADIPVDGWLFQGLFAVGDLGVWLGREKHRKSNMILQFAMCSALGRDFLGFKFVASKPLRVVLIDFESKSGSLKQRYDGIAAALGVSLSQSTLLRANLRIIEVRRIRKSGRSFPKFPHKTKQDDELKFWEELVATNPADVYIIDPLRTLHTADENDSSIETLMSEMHRVFGGAAVIAAHHMRKPSDNNCALSQDMRAWSEGARGSSAIKAHSDVIVLQERTEDSKGDEVVYLGAFLKDGADIEPFPLMESDHQSFYWSVSTTVPDTLNASYMALTKAGGPFKDKAKAVGALIEYAGVSRATAYRKVEALLRLKLLIEDSGGLRVRKTQS